MKPYYQICAVNPEYTKGLTKEEHAKMMTEWKPLNKEFVIASRTLITKFKTRPQAAKALPAIQKKYPLVPLYVAELTPVSCFMI